MYTSQDVKKRPPAQAPKPIASTQVNAQVSHTQTISHTNMLNNTRKGNLLQTKLDNKVVLRAPASYASSYQPQLPSAPSSSMFDEDARPSEDIYGIPAETQEAAVRDGDLVEDECEDDDFVTATQAIAWQDKWGQADPNMQANAEQVEAKTPPPHVASVMSPKVVLGITNTPTLGNFPGNTPDAKSIVTVRTSLGAITNDSTSGSNSGQNTNRTGVKRASPMGDGQGANSWQSGGKKVATPGAHSSSGQKKQSPPLWTSCSGGFTATSKTQASKFKTPVGPAPVTRKSPTNNGTLKTPPNSTHTVLRTPTNASNISPEMLGGKITPPMCGCGRRAKKNNVVSPGPNQGRGFYSCPNRKGGGRSSESALCDSTNRRSKQGCGYFKWESVVIREKLAMSGTPLSYKHAPVSRTPSSALGYKPTPSPVGRFGQSYISASMKGGIGGGKGVGIGRRLGMSQRTVLKPPPLK